MSWEVAKAAIERVLFEVARRKGSTLTLGFHGGGEPTMNWPVLRQSVEHVIALTKENGITCQICGAFNGFWSQRTLDFIINHFADISLSFDGPPKVQNAQRPAVRNRDSSTKVERSLRALDKAGFSCGIRMTITDFSVDTLAESVRYICENFTPKKIQAEPVFSSGRALENRSGIKDQGLFVDRLPGRAGDRPAIRDRAFLLRRQDFGCDDPDFDLAATRALIVTPRGDVTTCFEVFGREHPESDGFIVGKYAENRYFEIDSKTLGGHLARTVEICPTAETVTAGGAARETAPPKRSLAGLGKLFKPSERCFMNQELTKYLLLDKIRQSGGHIWNGQASC